MSSHRPWIVFYSHNALWPIVQGCDQRVHAMMAFLRDHFRVALIVDPYVDDPERLAGTVDALYRVQERQRPRRRPSEMFQLGRVKFADLRAKAECRAMVGEELWRMACENPLADPRPAPVLMLDRVCRELQPLAVVFEFTSCLVPGVRVARRHGAVAILDTHELKHRFHESMRLAGAECTRPVLPENEACLLRQADLLLAIQPDEAKAIKELVPHVPSIIVEHPFRTVELESVSADSKTVLFVGGASNHNLNSIRKFIERGWNQVLATHPGARLLIAGAVTRRLPERLCRASGVECLGFVPDLAGLYQRAAVAINPQRFGSGLKIKVVEALAHGRAIVTTPVGAEGFDGETALVVVEPDAVAGEVIDLLGHPEKRRELERASLALARNRFTPETCFGPLLEYLQKLSAERRVPSV